MFCYLLLLIALLINFTNTIEDTDKSPLKQQQQQQQQQRKRPYAALVFSSNSPYDSGKQPTCDWLARLKHQNKLCWKRRGLAQVLAKAKNLALNYCEEKFNYDQWNCSRKHKPFKKIYRETAFMYTIASSALVYTLARSCAEGSLAGCKCGEPEDNNSNSGGGGVDKNTNWKWGGCGDNSKFAKKFTKKFLQLRKKGDYFQTILKHNTEIGIRIVLQNENKTCRCHGVSGSCTIKICWKQLRSFDIIAEQLKQLYHNAVKIESNNIKNFVKNHKHRKLLLYLDDSPNFCPFTSNRKCRDVDNCATLCCGRGFYSANEQLVEKCNCSWRDQSSFIIHCEKCIRNQTIFLCK